MPFGQIYFAKLRFVATQIILQRISKTLGMFGSHHNARLYLCLCNTGHHTNKIENKFRRRVSNNRKIRVNALGNILFQFYLQLRVVLCIHNFIYSPTRSKSTRFIVNISTDEGLIIV